MRQGDQWMGAGTFFRLLESVIPFLSLAALFGSIIICVSFFPLPHLRPLHHVLLSLPPLPPCLLFNTIGFRGGSGGFIHFFSRR